MSASRSTDRCTPPTPTSLPIVAAGAPSRPAAAPAARRPGEVRSGENRPGEMAQVSCEQVRGRPLKSPAQLPLLAMALAQRCPLGGCNVGKGAPVRQGIRLGCPVRAASPDITLAPLARQIPRYSETATSSTWTSWSSSAVRIRPGGVSAQVRPCHGLVQGELSRPCLRPAWAVVLLAICETRVGQRDGT